MNAKSGCGSICLESAAMSKLGRWQLGGMFVVIVLASGVLADVKLPSVFSEHMVLQRDVKLPVWGTAAPGEEVTVTLGDQTQKATAGADGKWSVKLAAMPAGGPHTLVAKGKNTVSIPDVLVGEVWFASGQSNMALTVNRADNFEKEQAAAKFPQLRMFIATGPAAREPQADCPGSWAVCSPETVGKFSAAAYFFAREVHQKLGVPVGVIHSSVGGTPIESWVRADAQHETPELKGFFEEKPAAKGSDDAVKRRYEKQLESWKKEAAAAKAAGQKAPKAPRNPAAAAARKGNVGGLFNGKIAPFIPYAIRGALWYQGEANTIPEKAPYYQYQLPLLVSDWRKLWDQEPRDFPFAWVQLPNFKGAGRDISLVREAMLMTLRLPNTGMAITIDIGNPDNIHPTNKQDVGHRLALWALGTVFGRQVPSTSGPLPASHAVEGDHVTVTFGHADGGLVGKGGEVKGFTIAGEDKHFQPAVAKIDGEKVVVSSPEVKHPAAVRYAWENDPACNLYNGAGLPASPFRTDDWPAEP
jgi:sialate O-acetylesterase